MKQSELMVVFILTSMFLLGGSIVVDIVTAAKACEPAPTPKRSIRQWPNVRLCPDDLSLWDCIRDARYREDI